jgi:hypothetical protein
MRPSVDVKECEVYECPECGARFDESDDRHCDDCDTVATCLSNGRDL